MTARAQSRKGAGALRGRAVSKLRHRAATARRFAAAADAKRVLQELQIHQIELELQNEELTQAKSEADLSLEKYTDLYDFAPVGYFSLDRDGQIREANLTGAALLGVDRSRLSQRRFQLFVAPSSRPAVNAFLERIFAGREKQVCEAQLLSARGGAFWTDLQAKAAFTPDGALRWCRVAAIDIAARKQVEEAQHRIALLGATNQKLQREILRRQAGEASLRKSEQRALALLDQSRLLQKKLHRLSRQSLRLEENQRRQISRELHDKITQLLIGINVHLEVFIAAAALHPDGIRRTIAPLRRLVNQSVRTVHQFARDLRPAMLDDLGLIPALRTYIDDFPRRRGREIYFAAFAGVEALGNDKRTVLYRIAQEALINVAKHSQARFVRVLILKAKGGVCLEVIDDGKSFDVARLSSTRWSGRLGLTSMRERVEMVGGRFEIVSAPGAGTTVRAVIPFGPDETPD